MSDDLARCAALRDERAGEALGDIGSTLLFEDEHVRIWELRLEPGEASDLHHHEHDYYLVIHEGDRIAAVSPDPAHEPIVADLPADGLTVAMPPGATEGAFNIGEQTYRETIIERLG